MSHWASHIDPLLLAEVVLARVVLMPVSWVGVGLVLDGK